MSETRICQRLVGAAVAFILFLTISAATQAQFRSCETYQSEPSCLSMLSILRDNEYSMQMCRGEVERFVREQDEAKDCVVREAKSAIAEADERAKKAVQRFNCIARGGYVC